MAVQSSEVERKTTVPNTLDYDPNTVYRVEINGVGSRGDKVKDDTFVDGYENILHKFRTFTYNFTLAAVPPDAINDTKKVIEAAEKYAIIKSAGKKQDELQGGEKTEGFNNNSPGRFDLFLNNVEIDTLMAFNNVTNMAMATKISFDVFEPMSINGFMEALQVSSEAAGNVNYLTTTFVLKMEFVGYTDADDGPSIKLERLKDEGTRYFSILITNVQAKMDENGTRYSVKAIARNEMAFSDQNSIKESIQMKGATVGEICTSLMDALNQAAAEAAKTEFGDEKFANVYEVVFPSPTASGEYDYSKPYEKFANANITELTNDTSIFTFPAPGTVPNAYTADRDAGGGRGFVNPPLVVTVGSDTKSNPAKKGVESSSYDPTTSVLFTKGAKIHDIISSVIRDSEFGRAIVKKDINEVVKDQFIEYFHIAAEMEVKEKWNPKSLSPAYIYRFVVLPYKMHFSRFPLFQKELTMSEQNALVENHIRRTYSYLYTGQNVDVRSFNLTFNHLYFQAYPKGMNIAEFGPSDERTGKTLTAVPGSDKDASVPVPLSPRVSDPRRADVVGPGGNATRPTYDSYDALVKNMHQAILDNLSMIKCDLEILGDPYFLCTGGMGNFRPKLKDSTITDNGEAPYQLHDVMVLVEFRNPEDIDPNTGMAIFNNEKRIPYNGCYRVTKVVSKFQDGLFTQRLQLVRVPGQPIITSGRGLHAAGGTGAIAAFLQDVPGNPGMSSPAA